MIILKRIFRIKNALCIMGTFLGCYNLCFGQMSPASDIADKFYTYQSLNFPEKLFVHTDKDSYFAGDILWFKVYAADARSNKPVDLSKIAYLEIIDKDQTAVMQTKIPLKKGAGNGSVYLDASIKAGNYKIRAYTNWMKNFSPEFYFEKYLTVINTLRENATGSDNKPQGTYEMAFFPEGGNLVEGLKSKIAFKCIDQYGKGVDFEGRIINHKSETVAFFQPSKFGIGTFELTPQVSAKYSAIIKYPDGQILKTDLPSVFSKGYVMNLNYPRSNEVSVTVQTRGLPDGQIYLFVHTRNEKKISTAASVVNGKAVFSVNADQLGEGISSLTIFNESKQPVCERLYFKHPNSDLQLEASTNEKEYGTRTKVDVSISLRDLENKVPESDISVSVFRTDSLSKIGSNIASYLLLSSDLHGRIESPEYYLTSGDIQATDNLMLTHGWRRFKWETILQNKIPSFEFVPEYGGHIISGNVLNSRTGAPAKNILTYLSVPDHPAQFYTAKSDKDGRLDFYTTGFNEYKEILTTVDAGTDSAIHLSIASPFSSKFSDVKIPLFSPFKNTLYKQLAASAINVQVRNIYSNAQMNQFVTSKADSIAFYGKPVRQYLLDNYRRFKTMGEVLREYVAESALTEAKKRYTLRLLKPDLRGFIDGPLVILDGIPIFDINTIVNYDPLLVKSIDIINREYILGNASFNGIISFRTYTGTATGLTLGVGASLIDYEGVQKQREFYSPVYETTEQRLSRVPDFRDLLYWLPNASTNDQGNTEFSFYTSDQTGKYTIVIQGLTLAGQIINRNITFEVTSAVVSSR